ncbi:hypothetical protein MNBD_ALPHA06-485 [hydrothermal vent metagenome]|uniref:Uncharacterized protein n=1 Tax=hydrothermal vent metagenome TaxID=652676 RepID=A0A3B0R9S0_9ZZZZ
MTDTPFAQLIAVADTYGTHSLENYSAIRSLAERLRDGFCKHLNADDGECVYLVPPTGGFAAEAHGSDAFSVAGRGVLPLEPISFGLAVRVSSKADWLRVVFVCEVRANQLRVQIDGGDDFDLPVKLTDEAVAQIFEPLYLHIHDWFAERIKQFEQGSYGSRDIGFEIINLASKE